jgi:hypothetical protein
MTNKMYDELAIERAVRGLFGVDVEILQTIAFKIPISHTAEATLFLTTKKQLFLYITAESKLLFGDVKKLVAKMGLQADTYLPPKNRPNYFDEIGKNKFREVFPGRKHINTEDIAFYRTLAPYNPALILINEIKDGHVYQFDSDSTTNWRVAAKFAYRRIKTS